MGRMLLFDPYRPWRAANAPKAKSPPWPLQYERSNLFRDAP